MEIVHAHENENCTQESPHGCKQQPYFVYNTHIPLSIILFSIALSLDEAGMYHFINEYIK